MDNFRDTLKTPLKMSDLAEFLAEKKAEISKYTCTFIFFDIKLSFINLILCCGTQRVGKAFV